MADSTSTNPKPKELVRTLSATARVALEKLPGPAVVSVMEDMLRLASDGNNNNNNNGGGGGGSVTASRAGLTREELLQKLGASLSDEQLQNVLREQGLG